MNKKIAWIIVGLVVIAGVIFLLTRKADTVSQVSENNRNEVKNSSEQKSLKELAAGKPQECSVSYNTNGVNTTGKFYMAEGKMRGDYDSIVNGKIITSHFIMDGEYMTSWSSESEMGFKMKVTEQAGAEAGQNQDAQTQKVDINQKMDYECNDWSADSSKFSAPSSIKFTDYGQIMGGMQGGAAASGSMGANADMKAQQCAACEGLSGDSKTQCKAALSCK
jgi:hypothetical protein